MGSSPMAVRRYETEMEVGRYVAYIVVDRTRIGSLCDQSDNWIKLIQLKVQVWNFMLDSGYPDPCCTVSVSAGTYILV